MAPSRNRVLAARTLAIAADAAQIALLPLFIEGAASVAEDALDVVVGLALTALVGWHGLSYPAF